MGTIIIVAVAAVLLGLSVIVGLAASLRRQYISEDYFLAGHSLPWYVVACSVASLTLRLELWIGLVGLTCVAGLAAGGLAWSSFIGLTALSGVFLPYFVRKKIASPAEFLERRFSPRARSLFAVLAMLFLVFGVLVPALYVGGRVISEGVFDVPVTHSGIPWGFFACVAVIALVSSLAGVIGGSMAGAWAGLVQFLVIAVGGTVWAVAAVRGAGGLASLWASCDLAHRSLFLSSQDSPHPYSTLPWFGMIAFALTIGFWNTAVSPLTLQRCLGARSEWDARLGAIVGGLLLLVLPAVFILPGLAIAATGGLTAEADGGAQLIGTLLDRQNPLHAAGQGLVLAALLAAVMNTVAAAVHAFSALWTIDISQNLLQRNDSESDMVARGRRSSVAAIVLATLLTPVLLFWDQGLLPWDQVILQYMLEVSAMIGPPAAVVFLVSFFWPAAHGRAAVASLVGGCLVGAALWLFVAQAEIVPEWLKPVVTRAGVTGLVSLVLLGLVTFAIPASSQELYDPDASWSLDLAILPPHERNAGSGLGSLLVWWGLMLLASIAVWIVFPFLP